MINICSRNLKLVWAYEKHLIMKVQCKINKLPFYFNSKTQRKWKVSIGRKKRTKKTKSRIEKQRIRQRRVSLLEYS